VRKLKNTTFVCVDVEATGLDVERDRVVEVAAVRFTMDQILDEYETLIDPEQPIPQESIDIHHITQEMVEGKPKISEILPTLFSFIGRDILIGHAIQFDIDILSHEAKRSSLACSLQKNLSIDTLRLARLYGQSPSNALDVLRAHFNIEPEGAHRAMSDVLVNVQVFHQLVRSFQTIEEVQRALSKPIQMRIMPLGKHKGRAMSDLPLDYLQWAARQKFDNDLLFSLRKELNRRKKMQCFGQAVNPFHAL